MKNIVQVDTYRVMAEAVENGVAAGWRRAHKHTESPVAEHIKAEIEQAVLQEICEYFQFDSDE